jgi:hypothetical protein
MVRYVAPQRVETGNGEIKKSVGVSSKQGCSTKNTETRRRERVNGGLVWDRRANVEGGGREQAEGCVLVGACRTQRTQQQRAGRMYQRLEADHELMSFSVLTGLEAEPPEWNSWVSLALFRPSSRGPTTYNLPLAWISRAG